MQNLLAETKAVLMEHGKTLNDIVFISCATRTSYYEYQTVSIDIASFITVAERTFYDDGYGSQEIPPSLTIVGEDWWLERHEYDGSEWWEFKTMPKKPEISKTVVEFTSESYDPRPIFAEA